MSSSSNITEWIHEVRRADQDSARKLWDKYALRLQQLARKWFQTTGLFDEEDVAVSAFQTLYMKLQAGEFPDVNGRDAFWRLLAMIASRKASDLAKRNRTKKRGDAQTVPLNGPDEWDFASKSELPTDLTLIMAEQCREFLNSLDDKDLEEVVLLRLEGYSNSEIARAMSLSLRSVQRMTKLIREIWEKQVHD